MSENKMEDLIAQSKSTDVQVLLTAKENAKRAALDDPSQANLSALDRASKMLEGAMEATKTLKNWKDVVAFIQENGRKIGKTKLYEDIGKGLLKKQPDGTFRHRDVERYMASLPMSGTSDAVAEKAADRRKRKEEEEIRRIKVGADKDEFSLAVQKGRYIAKEQVHADLAARAVTLSTGIRIAFEARGLELVNIVDGNPKKLTAFQECITTLLDEAFNEYSREMSYEVTFNKVE